MATETVAEKTVVLHPGDVYLNADQAVTIRKALLVGLTAFGEIEEKINEAELAEARKKPWPDGCMPRHPTGNCCTVSEFAAALSYVEAWDS